MATSLGALAITLPLLTFIGLLAFGVVYLVVLNFDLSAAAGLGQIVLIAWRLSAPTLWVL